MRERPRGGSTASDNSDSFDFRSEFEKVQKDFAASEELNEKFEVEVTERDSKIEDLKQQLVESHSLLTEKTASITARDLTIDELSLAADRTHLLIASRDKQLASLEAKVKVTQDQLEDQKKKLE